MFAHKKSPLSYPAAMMTFGLLAVSIYTQSIHAQESEVKQDTTKILRLYHDADWSNNVESANAIWQGVHVALSEVDYRVQGYQIEVVKKDHRGNVLRSKRNIDAFLQDNTALAIISGMHSPPLIKHRQYINEHQVLTLVPWAAGGSITRHPSPENWVFRLSVDDTKVGGVLVDYALKEQRCQSPHLFLEDGAWGESNLVNIKKALDAESIAYSGVTRFGWNVKRHTMSHELNKAAESGADCVLLVSNVYEGAHLVNAMASLDADMRMPIISHWGITGGDFHQQVVADQREKVNLHFIQSCFSFLHQPISEKGQSVLKHAQALFPDQITSARSIRSPAGFIHGYDITQLLLAALHQVELTSDAETHRRAVRSALENLEQPVVGLVKTYQSPYQVFSDTNIDAHEALSRDDYCMAYYDNNDDVVVVSR